MNNIQLKFLLACIPSRLALAYTAKNFKQYNSALGIITAIVSIGFMYIYIFGLRKTGLEVEGGQIWWNSLRPVHSLLYGISSVMLLSNTGEPWKVLLLDAFIGLFAHINHHKYFC